MDPGQLGAGVDTQLVRQHLAGVVEGLQRLGLPSAPVEGDHQQPSHPLPERVLGHQRGQLRHGSLVAAELEQDVGPLFGGGRPQLGQPDPLGAGERPRYARERGSVPLAQGRVQRDDGPGQVAGTTQPAARAQPPFEDDRVHPAGVQAEHVAAGSRGQHLAGAAAGTARLEHPAQPGYVGVHPALGAGGRPLAPDGVDELVAGHDPVRPHREHAKHRLLPGRAGRQLLTG